jgi:hypothetical protein
MTKFGKGLVLANLIFSLLMATWAIGVFGNRIDFTNAKKPDQTLGEFAKREAQIKELKDAFRPADAAWARARAAVTFEEFYRPQFQDWYAKQLQHLRTGANAMNPAAEVDMASELARRRPAPRATFPAAFQPVVTNAQGQLTANPAYFETPKMVVARDAYNQPLRSLQAYTQEEQALRKSIETERDRYQKAIDQDMRLTAQLLGRDAVAQKLGADQAAALLSVPNLEVDRKGLRDRLQEERVKLQNLEDEINFLKPLRVNVAVENQLIEKRGQALEKRIEELKKIGVAVRP